MTDLKVLRKARRALAETLVLSGVDPDSARRQAQWQLEAGIIQACLERILPGARLELPADPAPLPPGIESAPEALSSLYQDFLDEELAPVGGRRRRGCFYTPATLVERILERVFIPETRSVLDSACGAGAFLSGALEHYLRAQVAPKEALSRLYGGEIDAHAASLCRVRLALEALAALPNPTESDWRDLLSQAEAQIRTGEALLGLAWEQGFELVVGNPPFLSAREMARAGQGEFRCQLSERFESARGAFDLAAVFVEHSLRLLQPGGKLGLVIPHKLFAAAYGAPLRKVLARECSELELLDHSHEKHFSGALAYPQILLATRALAPRELPSISGGREQSLAVFEERSAPLGSLCRIQCGTPGFDAAKTGELLCEGRPDSPAWPFLVTGSIDRYQILQKPLRFQHRRYLDPFLREDPERLPKSRRTLYSSPKIVVAGMVQRLEAAFDPQGHALGVNVYGLTEWAADPFFLLAIINSAAASFYYRRRFAEKHLASGFLAVNKGTLAQLPVPKVPAELAAELARLAREGADAKIDCLLYEFYGLDEKMRAEIEQELAELT